MGVDGGARQTDGKSRERRARPQSGNGMRMAAKGIVEAGDHQRTLDAARRLGLPAAALGIAAVACRTPSGAGGTARRRSHRGDCDRSLASRALTHFVAWRLNGSTVQVRMERARSIVREYEASRQEFQGLLRMEIGSKEVDVEDAWDVALYMVLASQVHFESEGWVGLWWSLPSV